MAHWQQGVYLDQEQFSCSICLDLLTEPVTLPCGHSYCRICIEGCWDQQGEQRQRRVYSCPQCRESFSPRPVLGKNNILAGVVENLRRTGGQSSAAEAKLVRATARLQDITCSSHNEPKKVYCRTDQQCICLLCAMDHHKGHDTVSALVERTDKQKQVVMSRQKVQQKIQERKKELNDLRPSIETLKSSAEAAVAASDKIFCEMISSVERTRRKVKELIRDQEKTAVAHAERLQRSLEEQIAQLERRNAELEELSSADDIHFIQSFRSLSMSTASPVVPGIVLHPLTSFTDVSDAVSGLRDKLEDILKTTWPQISDRDLHPLPPTPVCTHTRTLPSAPATVLPSGTPPARVPAVSPNPRNRQVRAFSAGAYADAPPPTPHPAATVWYAPPPSPTGAILNTPPPPPPRKRVVRTSSVCVRSSYPPPVPRRTIPPPPSTGIYETHLAPICTGDDSPGHKRSVVDYTETYEIENLETL